MKIDVTLRFDPSISRHYKVICLNVLASTSVANPAIYIFSSEKNFCSSILFDLTNEHAVSCNGAVQWYKSKESLFHLDLKKETLNEMSMPPTFNGTAMYFGESRGRLLVAVRAFPYVKDFEAECYNPRWTSRHLAICRYYSPQYRPLMGTTEFSVLSITTGEMKEDDWTIVTYEEGEVYSNKKLAREKNKLSLGKEQAL
ncbi:unnamed protein product [Dovyalis caffra]|uniref:F-box protein n=1 Tax=Dovyalis caffra TaxID=77055 RepID=A0AAV1S0K2_9ROSI|nr:unnamed protein product [Dovyalis caffra]